MKSVGKSRFTLLMAPIILMALVILCLFSSCTPQDLVICRVDIERGKSRALNVSYDPIDDTFIYYRAIYKGNGASFGDMSISPSYKKLTSEGILVSQGLWEIEVLFSSTDRGETVTPSTGLVYASSGNIFINLNTTTITVTVGGSEGYARVSSYTLTDIPSNITNPTVAMTLYKYNGSSFDTLSSTLTNLTASGTTYSGETAALSDGIYYAVFTVSGTHNGTVKTVFIDSVSFRVRNGMTANISGVCNTYNEFPPQTNIVDPGGTADENTDIKNFEGDEFNTDVTYVIDCGPNEAYDFIPDDPSAPNNKELNNQNVTIDMNGKNINNSTNRDNKTYFTINEGASLTLINSEEGLTNMGAANYGGNDASKDSNFIVNGGTFTAGSTDPNVSAGSININGVDCATEAGGNPARAAIEFSTYGGTINLLGPSEYVTAKISNAVRGIANILPRSAETDMNPGNLNLTINMVNACIEATGDSNSVETGIQIDGAKTDGTKYGGEININISGQADGNSIFTYNTNRKKDADHSAIVIKNYAGTINITLDSTARIYSEHGYGIYFENCTGTINIVNNGTIIGNYGAAIKSVSSSTPNVSGSGSLATR